MFNYHLDLPGNIHIALNTPCALQDDKKSLLQLGAHIPGFSLSDEIMRNPQILVSHTFSDEPSFNRREDRFDVRTPEQEGLPADICHLLYGITRNELLNRRLYPVHAACVGKDDQYTLLIGHSGSGKTTLALNLIENGLNMYSGNKTVVQFDQSKLSAIAGTKTVTKLDKDQKRDASELIKEQYAQTSAVNITSIHVIKLNDGVTEERKLQSLEALHTLYPFFLDTVNADVIVNGRDVYESKVSNFSKKALTDNLGEALHHIPVYKMAGSLDYLTTKVLSHG